MIRILISLIALSVSGFLFAQELVGHWTFESGEELKDRTGNFEDIILEDARVEEGLFIVDTLGAGTAKGYTGPDIGSHTMVFWIELLDIEADGGLPFVISSQDSGFDVLAYDDGGIRDSAWYIGSGNWLRSKPLDPGYVETSIGKMLQMAVRYKYINANEVEVAAFRNGVKIGEYVVPRQKKYRTGSTVISFSTTSGSHSFRFKLEEARLYKGALTDEQIRNLKPVKIPTETSIFWWWIVGGMIVILSIFGVFIRLRRRRVNPVR